MPIGRLINLITTLALVASLWACGGTTPVSVSVSPAAVTMEPGDQQVFVASVVGANDASVAWAATGGTIEGSGASVTFRAPLADGTYELSATSLADATARAVASITVAATAIDDATKRIDETGGVLVVDSGAVVDVPPGGMDGDGDFRVRTYDRARAYEGARVAPISLEVGVDVPVASLALGDEEALFYIGVPATDLTAEASLTLVFVDIGSVRYEFMANYHPVEENAIPIYVGQLNRLFEEHGSVPATIRISVQAVAFESGGVAGEAERSDSKRTGGLYRFLPNADLDIARTICRSNDETTTFTGLARATTATTLPSGHVPLVLVHGWQEAGVELASTLFMEKAGYNTALCGWLDFMEYVQGDNDLNSRYEIYSFGYDSRDAISLSAAFLRNELKRVFVDQPVVILAHSMGGVISDRVIQARANDVHHLITLGTPFRGTRLFMCTESTGDRCTHLRMLAGLNKLPVFAAIASSGNGTLDLTWEFGGIEYTVARICDGGVCVTGSGLTRETVPNPVLAAQNADLSSALRANYNTVYGRIGSDGPYGWVQGILFDATGLVSDGVVPTQSACLSASTGIDNACLHSTFGTRTRFFTLHHNDLKDDGGTFPYLKGLLEAVWPAPPVLDIEVSVTPTSATLEPNASRSFTATVTGVTNTSVSWSATCGGIAGTGNTITYTAPSSAGSCALTARSVADASRSASATVTVAGGEPTAGADLVVVEDIVLDPTPMRAGELSTVRFIVRNQGDGTAAASTAFLGVNRSTSGPPMYERGERFEVPSLAAGAVYEVATSATLPDGFWSGTYVLWAVADIHSTAGQSNESNDATYEVFVIEGQDNPCQYQDVEVTFPDADLEGAVRAELSQPTGPITCWGMYGLGMLGPLDDLDIASLEGLQYAGTLDTLWIGGGGRDLDLSPLADLPLLYFLEVVASGVDDLAPLANLDSLRLLTLNLSDTGDLTPLSGLRLTDFSMNESGIANLWPLAGMESLSRLQLNRNQISDLSPLEGLSNLTELYLGGNQIRNVTAIAGMTELTGLYLSGNQISDISPLADFTKLTQLMLYDNQISELDPLVDNVGLGAGDEVNLRGNCLDLRTGSPDMAAIDILVSRGVDVSYYPQADCGSNGDDSGPSPTPAGEHITNGDFSSGATGWLIGPDFWIGEGERYRSPPNYAAGGVNTNGSPIPDAEGLMQQTVAIPAGVSQAWFSFWYYISSDDSRAGRDTLNVLVAGTACEILVASFDNLDTTDGVYRQHLVDVSDCIGETVDVSFVATTDELLDTVFRIDDVSLISSE